MNSPDLQLNLYDLISCSCWDDVVLHVGMQLFLGGSKPRKLTLFPSAHFHRAKIDALLRCRQGDHELPVLCADSRDNPQRALLSKKEHSCICTISVKPLFCSYNFSLTHISKRCMATRNHGECMYRPYAIDVITQITKRETDSKRKFGYYAAILSGKKGRSLRSLITAEHFASSFLTSAGNDFAFTPRMR